MIRLTITNGTLFKTFFVEPNAYPVVARAAARRQLRIVAVNVGKLSPSGAPVFTRDVLDAFDE